MSSTTPSRHQLLRPYHRTQLGAVLLSGSWVSTNNGMIPSSTSLFALSSWEYAGGISLLQGEHLLLSNEEIFKVGEN